MSPAVDLEAWRTVRALRAGQTGVFAAVWNDHADEVWSVLRGTFGNDGEALGWMTSFRVELDGQISSFDADISLREQIGLALRRHVAVGLASAGRVSLPERPSGADPLASFGPAQRLDLLLAAFFELDLPESCEAPPGLTLESLAQTYRQTTPNFGKIAAIEAGAPAHSAGPRWVVLGVLLASLLVVPIGWRLWRMWTGDLAPSELREVQGVTVHDPLLAARVLRDRGVPWLVAEVPDAGGCGLTLQEVAHDDALDTMVVFVYQDQEGQRWRIARVRSSETPFPPRTLDGQAVVQWREEASLWSVEARVPLDEAEPIQRCLAVAPRWRAGPV